jgi:hypothetical protein
MPAPAPKTVPVVDSIEELAKLLSPHPEDDHYQFFENATENPFDSSTFSFRVVNAWWLIDTSFLVYSVSEPYIKDRLRNAGMADTVTFGFNGSQGMEALVTHNHQYVFIAFRGTDFHQVVDVMADIEFIPTFAAHGLVHYGFWKFFHTGSVWADIQRYLGTVAGDQVVWFTGHSLGAALATLAANQYRDARGRHHGLYTFGSPRVGDQALFCRSFGTLPIYRIVNDQDITAHVPPPPLYGHVGKLVHLGANSLPYSEDVWAELEAQFSDIGGFLGVFDFFKRKNRFREYLEDLETRSLAPLGDHSPEIYATKLWNYYCNLTTT